MKKIDPAKQHNYSELRWKCDESVFTFSSTAELEPLMGIVGQHRAIEAIQLGAEIQSRGYNIFVISLIGTGRLTTVQQVLKRHTNKRSEFWDFCYVNNFKNPDLPRLLKFKKGQAKRFVKIFSESIEYIKERVPKLLDEKNFRSERNSLTKKYSDKQQSIFERFDNTIRPKGFALGQIQNEDGTTQQEIFAIVKDQAVQIDQLANLVENKTITQKQAQKIVETYTKLRQDLIDTARQGMKVAHEFKKALIEFDKAHTLYIVKGSLDEVRSRFPQDSVLEYLDEVEHSLLENVELFFSDNQEAELPSGGTKQDALQAYSVNVILDNSTTTEPPVVIETSPTYTNLFGTIERKIDSHGYVKSDFTLIKAGAFVRANGGYLVLNANDVLADVTVWQALKRVLLYGRLEIQSLEQTQVVGASLKPESIPNDVKVILLGDHNTYSMLSEVEEDFTKIFKIVAEFDYEAPIAEKMFHNYARFIARICNEEQLIHANPSGVAGVIEWGVKQTENRNKLSINFSDVADLVRESAYIARANNKRLFTRESVEQALQYRKRRAELLDVKIKEQIQSGSVLIDTHTSRIGQINGLTVISTGIVSFGQPSRITATTSVGSHGIVNIERESDLSGSIHNKGVLIISGLLRNMFARKHPLALTASVSFEQNYGGVDGDSASAAELYAILSSLANVPINQHFAVTGSINQHGDIQSIGGVNEKITGFYEICAHRGLHGKHGVIIPAVNAKDLMLDTEIIKAVKAKKFSVYSISRFEQAIPLLMNIEAGTIQKNGEYSTGSLFAKVSETLAQFAEAARNYSK